MKNISPGDLMDPMESLSTAALRPAGLVEGAVRLYCCSAGPIDERIQLLVEGILIGELSFGLTMRVGQTIDIPVKSFPRVSLPAAIRFKAINNVLALETTPVKTLREVHLLAGKGEVKAESYTVESGSIVCFLSNLTNGLWEPAVYARINGSQTRVASVDHIALRDEGGCTVKLRIPMHSTDLHTGGLRVEVFCADRDGAVELIEYRRVEIEGVSAELGRLETESRAHYGIQMLRIAALERELKKMMAALETRMESFLEYMLALTLDKLTTVELNGQKQLSVMDNLEVASEIEHLRAEIRKEVSSGANLSDGATPSSGEPIMIKPESGAFYEGWNSLERDTNQIAFRWMQRKGSIRLPCPYNSIQRAIVKVARCYKGDAPSISAYVDGRAARVYCYPLSRYGEYDILVTPNALPQRTEQQESILTLESNIWGSPSDDGIGKDSRTLSLMIRQVEVYLHIKADESGAEDVG